MITYELAKELKEAGLGQCGDGWIVNPEEKDVFVKSNGEKNSYYFGDDSLNVYIPTLTELIEACGDRFGVLSRPPNVETAMAWGGQQWRAGSMDFQSAFGSTPEEAVARLWLALNKKQTND